VQGAYSRAGVRPAGEIPGFGALLRRLAVTFTYPAPESRPVIDFGYYANVIPVTPELGVAISTDGVGTKILVAEALGKFDTIGIDCVAMNVNDVICVGAVPLTMVDYVAIESPSDDLLEQLGIGLAEGARLAGISIPGGELAQVPDMVRGIRPGSGVDLVGTCIGTVPLDRVLTGSRLVAGDALIGLASSGIHSNGLTLARRHLTRLEEVVPELGCSVGEELLKPTRIYAPYFRRLVASEVDLKALLHITGDGFLNLSRVRADVSFEIDDLPEVPPVFGLIQASGEIPDEDMFLVFNMGIGLVAVVPEQQAARAVELARDAGYEARLIGTVTGEPGRKVYLRPRGLVGEAGRFRRD
jgi:phosphoribosylformylglycinamidine cyclo-ligase